MTWPKRKQVVAADGKLLTESYAAYGGAAQIDGSAVMEGDENGIWVGFFVDTSGNDGNTVRRG